MSFYLFKDSYIDFVENNNIYQIYKHLNIVSEDEIGILPNYDTNWRYLKFDNIIYYIVTFNVYDIIFWDKCDNFIFFMDE